MNLSNDDFNNIFDDDIEEMKEDNSSSNINENTKASSNEDASQNLNIQKHNIKKENNPDAVKIQKAFNNKNFLRRNNVNNVSTEEETAEELEQQEENEVQEEQKQSIKEKIINKTANKAQKKEAKDASKTGAQKAIATLAKPLKLKLMVVGGIIIIGLLLAIFLIYLILGPLMDSWKEIDRGARNYADRIEKLSNFYKGFGFEDSKTAFYNELDSLDQFYDYNLDIPLLLSTLFYPETKGYDTAYQEHIDVINSDPIMSLYENGTDGFIEYFKNWTKDIINEAGNTYDDETGLVYNASKIFRLRRLAAAMCTKSDMAQKMSLDDFLRKFDFALTKAVKDFISTTFSNIFSVIKETVVVALKTIWDSITLDFEGVVNDWGSYFNKLGEICRDQTSSLAVLLSVISFGLIEISTIHYEVGTGVVIEYFPYKVDEDKYEEYLKNYYFETTPEFSKLLPESETNRIAKKAKIMSEINTNTKLFRDVFLPYGDGLSEGYEDSCVGAIKTALTKELKLPVDIKSDSVVLSQNDMFGIMNGIRHNGVTLTNSNTGINLGDEVKSIAQGKVIEIGRVDDTKNENSSKNNTNDIGTSTSSTVANSITNSTGVNSNWIKVEHNILLNNDEYKFYTIYKFLGSIADGIEVGKSIKQEQKIGTVGTVEGYNEASVYFEFRNEQDVAIDPTNLFIPCKTSAELVGDTNEEKIWNYYIGLGYNKAKTAAIVANVQNESGYDPGNVEDCVTAISDEGLVSGIDNNSIGVDKFMNWHGNGCDSYYNYEGAYGRGVYGFGLAQWTSEGRKENLYNLVKERSVSIADIATQLDYLHTELEESWMYPNHESVWRNASTLDDVSDATYSYCSGFEVGTGCSARRATGIEIYNRYANRN